MDGFEGWYTVESIAMDDRQAVAQKPRHDSMRRYKVGL